MAKKLKEFDLFPKEKPKIAEPLKGESLREFQGYNLALSQLGEIEVGLDEEKVKEILTNTFWSEQPFNYHRMLRKSAKALCTSPDLITMNIKKEK